MHNNIARMREERGWTQDHLALLLGLEGPGRRMVIQRWEHGQRDPSLENVKRLLAVFGCTFEEMF